MGLRRLLEVGGMLDHGAWRSADDTKYLKQVERSGFAWEFLRRNPDYRRDFEVMNRLLQTGNCDDVETVLALVRRWGLGFPLRPSAPVRPGPGRLGRCNPADGGRARHDAIPNRQQQTIRRRSRRNSHSKRS